MKDKDYFLKLFARAIDQLSTAELKFLDSEDADVNGQKDTSFYKIYRKEMWNNINDALANIRRIVEDIR